MTDHLSTNDVHLKQTECKRCGTCCRNGGPALHLEDLPLVESGKIPLKALFTIRQGEPCFDNVKHTIAPAVTDIIKVKNAPQAGSACYYYHAKHKNCSLYDQRPQECRTLECWDVSAIEQLYNCRRLTRRHVLSKVDGLWDLVDDHQERCDYGHVAELAQQARRPSPSKGPQQDLLELVRYDENLRQLTVERMNLDPEMLEFLFGRPLSFTIGMFQLKYDQNRQKLISDKQAIARSEVCYRRNGFG